MLFIFVLPILLVLLLGKFIWLSLIKYKNLLANNDNISLTYENRESNNLTTVIEFNNNEFNNNNELQSVVKNEFNYSEHKDTELLKNVVKCDNVLLDSYQYSNSYLTHILLPENIVYSKDWDEANEVFNNILNDLNNCDNVGEFQENKNMKRLSCKSLENMLNIARKIFNEIKSEYNSPHDIDENDLVDFNLSLNDLCVEYNISEIDIRTAIEYIRYCYKNDIINKCTSFECITLPIMRICGWRSL